MTTTDLEKSLKSTQWGPKLHTWPSTGKVWVTMVIIMMSLGLAVALGQIVVHDIIPTFQESSRHPSMNHGESETHSEMRGDLFSDTPVEKKLLPFTRPISSFLS